MWSTIVLGEAVPVIALRSSQSEAGRRRAGAANLSSSGHAIWYVYIIQSINFPDQEYTGATRDLRQRVSDHNSGKSTHTSKFAPWELRWYCAFPDKYKALDFEKYFKSASGRAFAKTRL
ncbi:MAG: GIY-YIG nuclease family protein [Hyphomicrobiales bacterium]